MPSENPISFEIAEEVAAYEGTRVEDLHPPLHDAIDTDALDAMFRSSGADRILPSVEFTYKGYTIHVDNSSEITIRDRAPTAEPTKETA
ncbi:hypothetical protein SAMN04489842_0512 [Natronobacterium texcoconense]|uniref:Halobacterial output domain-containing protein n=2 Tax=Natronobacterium texcoconense TaxID=1095778 RepID=A0A1H1A0N1_NATTX|nr:hypothetical protein SAMN04489842_0512 [Natronobacterium texcoconense]